MHVLLRTVLFISLFGFYTASQAELTIEITKGVETAVPIAVVPFGLQSKAGKPPLNLSAIIQADLNRSGLFKTLAERDMLTKPTEVAKVRYRNWQALGQEYLVIGKMIESAGKYQVQFQLFDIYKGEQILGYRLTVSARELRRTAHHISDLVYEKLTGKKGVFSTRIAYVTKTSQANKRKLFKLKVADADGYNPRVIASSVEPLMSPSWSADGKKIAYVSFENRRSAIFVQTLASGKRIKVAAYKGINGAPAFSPDGSRLALTLSKDGSADIYVLNLRNKGLLKLTKSYGIDTEPAWSPDGKLIVYTSDRGGKPQLYTIPSTGGRSNRLTFDGSYNARGRYSSDGKSIAMVHANNGDYRIAIMDLATRTVNVLTAGRYDESPSFSPNGEMILYASRKGRKNVLSAVSVDGRTQQNLAFDSGDVREPAWSP
ncbi:MAG: Tol-Pal system beta propeller repeat protein TolB [Methylococcaceae bacterium]